MTLEPRTTQKDAAREVLEVAYMAASANDTLPALVSVRELRGSFESVTVGPPHRLNRLDWL
jgi:hypothetical protein